MVIFEDINDICLILSGMFEDFEFEEKFNPWDVQSVEDFRLYCCPECSTRNVHKSDFIRHAVTFHPNSNIIIEKLEDNKDDVKPIVSEVTKTVSTETSDENVEKETSSLSVTESGNTTSVTKDDCTLVTENKSTVTLCYTSDDSSNGDESDSSDDEEPYIEAPTMQPTKELEEHISSTKSANIHSSNIPDEKVQNRQFTNNKTIIEGTVTYINDASSLPDSKLPTILDSFSINANTEQPMTLQTQDNVEDNSDRSSFHKEQLKSGKPYDVRYNCNMCDKSFSRKGTLKAHIKTVHEDVRYNCGKCDKSFSHKGTLKAHIKTVHEDVRYNCGKCDKSFTQKSHLNSHIQSAHENVHENVQYNCEKCDKNFSKNSNLNAHIKSAHENVRYNCEKCDKSFSQKKNLNTHIRSIHENVRYNCEKCDKSFTQKGNLQGHIQSNHRGIRYKCDKCDKSFSQKLHLNTHIDSVHKNRDLKRHIKNVHENVR